MEGVWVSPFGQFSSPQRGVSWDVMSSLSAFSGKPRLYQSTALLLPLHPPASPLPPVLAEVHFQGISSKDSQIKVQNYFLDSLRSLRIPRSYFILSSPSAISSFPGIIRKGQVTSVYQRKYFLNHILFPYSICRLHRSERSIALTSDGLALNLPISPVTLCKPLTSLSPHFFLCKMGVIIVPVS